MGVLQLREFWGTSAALGLLCIALSYELLGSTLWKRFPALVSARSSCYVCSATEFHQDQKIPMLMFPSCFAEVFTSLHLFLDQRHLPVLFANKKFLYK